MRRLLFAFIIFVFYFTIVPPSSASWRTSARQNPPTVLGQEVNNQSTQDHTVKEEQEGRQLWEKLNRKEISCDKLSDEQLGALGEFFMGRMVGDSHKAMNQRMEQMMGKEGEKQMHVVMGKRLSGCDPNALMSQNSVNGMMWMMGSAFAPPSFGGTKGGGSSMMGGWGPGGMMNWGGFGWFGIIGSIFWIVILADLVLVGVWLWKQIQKK